MTVIHCYQIHYFARTSDSRFLLPLPAFTCALPLSAGRTGQPDDLLPEFDVEIMPGTASRPAPLSPSSGFSVATQHFTDQSNSSLTNQVNSHLTLCCGQIFKPHKSFTSAHDLNLSENVCCRFQWAHPEEVCCSGLDALEIWSWLQFTPRVPLSSLKSFLFSAL